jgi:hypothetical protein
MWAPKAVAVTDGEGTDAPHTDTFEIQTGPTWQQLARNSATTFVSKLDGQGMGVAAAAMNDTFSRNLWSQSVFVEAFIMKGGLPLICRLASTASDDALFYQYYFSTYFFVLFFVASHLTSQVFSSVREALPKWPRRVLLPARRNSPNRPRCCFISRQRNIAPAQCIELRIRLCVPQTNSSV